MTIASEQQRVLYYAKRADVDNRRRRANWSSLETVRALRLSQANRCEHCEQYSKVNDLVKGAPNANW